MRDLTSDSLQGTAVHDKEYTVKLTLPQAGKPYMRDDIVSALVDSGLAAKYIVCSWTACYSYVTIWGCSELFLGLF